ncbi:MAG: HD domain-containing protein [Patescibacteria group bacterium]|nr:HD domain-containing protein [Patescibacteria group bacterium]
MIKTEKRWLSIFENALENEMAEAPARVATHDVNHVRRVWKYAKEIAKDMDVDWEVLIAAVFLHDIGRHYPEGVGTHGPISVPFAEKVLREINFPQDKIDDVLVCIKFHDESFTSSERQSLESKVLYDADKTDVFGPIGVFRYLVFNTARGKTLKETADYALENIKLKYKRLELGQTKNVMKNKYNYVINYFLDLKKEIE